MLKYTLSFINLILYQFKPHINVSRETYIRQKRNLYKILYLNYKKMKQISIKLYF